MAVELDAAHGGRTVQYSKLHGNRTEKHIFF